MGTNQQTTYAKDNIEDFKNIILKLFPKSIRVYAFKVMATVQK